VGLAAVGNGQHDVVFRHDAQIAVHPFYGMQENGLCPRARERGDDFFADQSGFADARDDDPAFGLINDVDRFDKTVIDPVDQLQNAFRLNFQNLAGLPQGWIFCHLYSRLSASSF